MKTIAREAGGQLTTVSCILNNKGGKYSEQTRAKVLAVAREIGLSIPGDLSTKFPDR